LTFVKTIKSISELINKYDLFIIDQWGVIHNGKFGYTYAIDCIKQLFNLKKILILISNSSKRNESTINRLPELGFNKNNFSEVMTSGEMIWRALNLKSNDFIKKLGNNCYHLSYTNNKNVSKFTNGLNFNFVNNLDDANFILGCTASPKLTTLDYIPLLEKAIKKNLPFICANPDFETIESNSEKKIISMGTIAELYKDFGGSVFILGKPSIEIYNESTKKFPKINKNKILAIGDSFYHDIKGAHNFNIDSMLITSGIHSSMFDKINPKWEKDKNELKKFNFKPTYLCEKFKF